MMHRAWSSIVEVPYCFSRSSVKFQGHTALKIVEFDPNWAFPDCNSSFNSPLAMKCCTKAWNSKGEMPYCFPRSSIKFQGHTVLNITDFDPNWAFLDYRPVAAFKSLRFALFLAATKQLYKWYFPSVRLSVCLSHLFDYVPIIVSSWNFQGSLPMTKVRSMQKVKVRGQRSRSQRSQPNLTVSGL